MKNEEKLNIIYEKYRENKNSHVYLVETNSINNALNDIKELIIKINEDNKENDFEYLIKNDALPTLTVVEPETQEIKIESIDNLITKLQKVPVITKENYFIICGAEKLNQKSGNAMLKLIEEPESDILGFFICNNISKVMQTIQSRSQFVSLNYDIKIEYDVETENDAKDYFMMLHNEISIYGNKRYVDKYKSIDSMVEFLECFIEIENKYIKSNSNNFDIINRENKIIMLVIELISNIKKNGNIGLLLDKFVIEVGRL